MNRRGVTLVELIMAIVIIAIVASSIAVTLENVLRMNAEEQTIPIATLLGQALMEDIASKRYDENTESPWTTKANLGPEEAVRANFDDVDDFSGWQEDPISGYPGYSSTVDIYYVNPGDLDVEASIAGNEYTDFKKIMVTISYEGKKKTSLVAVSQGY